jgi:aldehyde:ferredoxin oxidoreductase
VPFLNAATGLDYTEEDLLLAGARMQSLSRMYNMKKGRSHEDDTLPERFFEEESVAGLMKGEKIPKRFFEKQVQEVFKIRGWDKEGFPTEETLEKLSLKPI